MSKFSNYRKQSTVPDAPVAEVVGVFADASGFLVQRDSSGTNTLLGTNFSGSLSQNVVRVRAGAINTTGAVFTADPSATTQTGLANPSLWLPIRFNGTGYLIPAYPLT